MGKIYTDTNRFLDFYRAANDNIDFFDELHKFKESVVLTEQTITEFRRNRVSTLKSLIANFKKTINVASPYTSTVLRQLPAHKKLTELMAAYKKEGNKILEHLDQLRDDESRDPVAQKFVALATDPAITKLQLTDHAIERAHRRKLLGNPPCSPDRYSVGDEVIWELLIDNMKEDLIIVTRDHTFRDNLSLLKEEFHQRTGKRLLLVTDKFSVALKEIGQAATNELIEAERNEPPSNLQPTTWTVEIRTGRAPSKKSDPDSGIRLATLDAYTSPDAEHSGRVWANGTADGSGQAGHFRVKDEDGKVVFQGAITTTGRGGDLAFDNDIVVAGGMVMISYCLEEASGRFF